MRTRTIFFTASLLLINSFSYPQTIKVTSMNCGSVITELSYNIKVNENSSLQRSCLTFNDPSCPVQLSDAGIVSKYDTYDKDYEFTAQGSLSSGEQIAAIEIRFLLFDVFGEHIKTLSSTQVKDIVPNTSPNINTGGGWRAWENEIRGYLTSIAFVAQVRTSAGTVWRFNEKGISAEILKTHLKMLSGILDPSTDKTKK